MPTYRSLVARIFALRRPSREPREESRPDATISAEFRADDSSGGGSFGRLRTLGTFGGVFTPSFLTIIGVIMYLRFSWVVGNAGLVQALAIVLLANVITGITAVAVSSIGSNERMETGGAYFMVSRVLGFQAGGSIGIPLYLSQALSTALYVLGFAEAITVLVPDWSTPGVALVTMLVLALLGLVGARLMVKVQYLILAAILVSFASIALGFQPLETNFAPAYRDGLDFWAVFAVFFPAVTGILAGVSMSGDLKDPAKSIPRGTLLAVAAGFVVYILVPIMLAFSVPREQLFASTALRDAARWPVLVTVGVMGATLSSAIGSLMAAPRTLQALASDRIAPAFLAHGVGPTKEPVVAMILSMIIAAVAIVAGNLNAVAEVLTMFFLTTYGVLNLSAGMEHVVGNPSFRPSIRAPAWLSFLGSLACLGVMVLISPLSATIAVAAVAAIYTVLAHRTRRAPADANVPAAAGVWEGFWTRRLFSVSRRLDASRSVSGKNWRPIVQLFAGDETVHGELMITAAMMASHGGALAIYAIADRSKRSEAPARRSFEEGLRAAARALPVEHVFANVVETAAFHEGVLVAAQAAAFAGSSYNTVMLGFPRASKRDTDYALMLASLSRYRRNVILLKRGPVRWLDADGPIVVWWGGRENNARLMLILAHLLDRARPTPQGVRVATIVRSAEQADPARISLNEIVRDLRISARVSVVVNDSDDPIASILGSESTDASLVVLGMAGLDETNASQFLPHLRDTTARLAAVLLVQCNSADVEYV